MDDRPGHEPAQPPEPREDSGEDAPPPRGFSFPSATDASGSPAPHAPTFSLPDDTEPAGGRYGQPYPGNAAPPGPGAPGYETPSPVAYPNPGYQPPSMPTSSGYGQPPGGHGPVPTSGYGNPWGPENTGPGYGSGPVGPPPGYRPEPGYRPAPGYGSGPAAPGYGAPAGDAGPSWAFSGPDTNSLGFGGQPSAGFGNQPPGPKDQQALIAMVVGLASTVLALAGCCYLGPRIVAGLAGVAAVVVGIIAQQRISKSTGRLTGTPQAAIGIASGAVAIFLALLVALVTLLN